LLPLVLLFAIGYASYFVPFWSGLRRVRAHRAAGLIRYGLWLVHLRLSAPAGHAHALYPASNYGALGQRVRWLPHVRSWWAILNTGGFVVAGVVFFRLLAILYIAYMGLVFTILLCWLAPLLLVL
jgi:hypothetical protein